MSSIFPKEIQGVFNNLTLPLTTEIREDLKKLRKQIMEFVDRFSRAYKELLKKPSNSTTLKATSVETTTRDIEQ
jgi:hypothetical protein